MVLNVHRNHEAFQGPGGGGRGRLCTHRCVKQTFNLCDQISCHWPQYDLHSQLGVKYPVNWPGHGRPALDRRLAGTLWPWCPVWRRTSGSSSGPSPSPSRRMATGCVRSSMMSSHTWLALQASPSAPRRCWRWLLKVSWGMFFTTSNVSTGGWKFLSMFVVTGVYRMVWGASFEVLNKLVLVCFLTSRQMHRITPGRGSFLGPFSFCHT